MHTAMAIAGVLSIYLGYKLFCDSAYQRNRFRHLLSGALLAMFGLGILIADFHGVRMARNPSRLTPNNLLRYSRPAPTNGVIRTYRIT